MLPFLSLREEYVFEKMFVCMTVWSSKKVPLLKNCSSGVCDVSQCWRLIFSFVCRVSYSKCSRAWRCFTILQGFRNILVCLRMFAAKIVVPAWMLIIWFAIEELGLRGRVNLSLGISVFLRSALCSVGFPRPISCTFEDVSYRSRSSVTSFPYMPHFTCKT